jgi:hypothetical protein
MSIYEEWGFSSNPFQTTALPPDSLGRSLLVGRDQELTVLRRRLENPPRIPTLEGLNGVGKSSLVNVAAYTCYMDFLEDPSKPMLIPCRRLFQLRPNLELDPFIENVYREVAQTLIDQARKLEGGHINLDASHEKLDKWLNAPQVTSYQGGISVLSAGYSSETNTGEGFSKSGFVKATRNWLEEIFPTPRDGGVVCVIDNLELLQTSEAARRNLEALRDELLTIPGLRWVLCGALGIVLGIASSPRLEGILSSPIDVKGVADDFIREIFNSRVKTFASDANPYLPLRIEDFERLYGILFKNLRSLLGHADVYCQWIADRDAPTADYDKRQMFQTWLDETSRKAYDSAREQVRPRAWKVFEDAIAIDGSFSPSDFEHFQFNSIPAFRPHVRDLEAAGLVVSTQDDGDKRRKTIQITPKGWLVHEWAKRT